MRDSSGREGSGVNGMERATREKGSRYPRREREERQGPSKRGAVNEREGEQVSWRRGKPGTNRIRSANESEGQQVPSFFF